MSDSLNFENLISSLHSQGVAPTNGEYVSANLDTVIEITSDRAFKFSEGFNKTIAYVGDVNSQIIIFKLPIYHEGHSLADCSNKKVVWTNPSNGVEGSSNLTSANEENTLWKWIVPPALFAKEGKIEFSIAIYDLSGNQIAFSWNTPVCTELQVKKTSEKVSAIESMPARDEILMVDIHTKKITAPNGYNNTVAIAGDIGVSSVYFQIEKNVKGMDVLYTDTTSIIVNYQYNGSNGQIESGVEAKRYTIDASSQGTELALIEWNLDDDLTCDAGTISVSLTIETKAQVNGKPSKRWSSLGYNNLTVGKGFAEQL